MDGKTSKPAFDKARTNKKTMPRRNYTHKELIMKTDAYASVAKTKEQEKEMLDIKNEYYVDKEKTNVNRFVRNRNFEMGKRAGLHQGKTIEDLERQNKVVDQGKRNKAMDKAKTYYYKNYSLPKIHKEAVERSKSKDISKDI